MQYIIFSPHFYAQIPLSAVEMPEDAMAALDVQFSGLEFGTETFDFTADVKTSSNNSGLVSTTPINSRDPSSATPPVTKDLTSATLSSSLPPSQKVSCHLMNILTLRKGQDDKLVCVEMP